jgi:hypothetical protein
MNKQHIKGFILGITILFLFMFLFSQLIPTRIGISKTINAPIDSVKTQLTNIKNWQYWYKPLLVDSNLVPMYSPNTIGKNVWVNYGDNTITITDIKDNEIKFEVKNTHGQIMPGGFNIIAGANNDVELYWYFKTANKWLPWQRLRSIALEKIMKPEMRASIDNLSQVATNGYKKTGAFTIQDDFVDDHYLIATPLKMDSTIFFDSLFSLAQKNREALYKKGITDDMLSTSFYIRGTNNNFTMYWGIKANEQLLNNKNLTILNHSKGKRQYSLTMQKGLDKLPENKAYLSNYVKQKTLAKTADLDTHYTKFINWQYASKVNNAQVKLLIIVPAL